MVSAFEIAPYILGASRALGLVLFLPLGWDLVGIAQRLALTCGFAIALPIEASPDCNWALALRFFIAGAMLGWPLALVTDLAASFGELVDAARGVMIAEILDPLQSITSSHLSVISRYGAWVCFLASGGMGVLVTQIAHANLPVIPSLAESGRSGFIAVVNLFTQGMIQIAPVFVIFLSCEFAIAIVIKVSSNISLSTEAAVLKTVIATLILVQFLYSFEAGALLQGMYG